MCEKFLQWLVVGFVVVGVMEAKLQKKPTGVRGIKPNYEEMFDNKDAILDRVIVKLLPSENRFDSKWDEIISSLGGSIIKRSVSNTANFIVVKLPYKDKEYAKEFIENMNKVKGVEYAELDGVVRVCFNPNDPYWSSQWGPQHINAPQAWDIETGDMSVTIAIIDQGVQYDHPDLDSRFTSNKGYDFVDNDTDPYPDDPSNEDHGTHVAGIAAATLNNSIGIAGIAGGGCRLVSLRVLDESGYGSLSDVADAIYYAADSGYQVLNMSLGSSYNSSTLENACQYAWDNGCLLVAASGNNYGGSVLYPAAYSTVIAVGALDQDGTLANYSNYGPEQELTAPGTDILSCVPTNNYAYMSGTSMATPHVSGVAGLLFSYFASWSNSQVRTQLQNTADDRGPPGWDQQYGYGCVDAYAALGGGGGGGGCDTIAYTTNITHYLYVTDPGEQLSEEYNPSDFGLSYPIEIYGVFMMFYYNNYTKIAIWNSSGSQLGYTYYTPTQGGTATYEYVSFSSPITITSGSFYAGIETAPDTQGIGFDTTSTYYYAYYRPNSSSSWEPVYYYGFYGDFNTKVVVCQGSEIKEKIILNKDFALKLLPSFVKLGENIKFYIYSPANKKVSVKILDISGRIVFDREFNLTKGRNVIKWLPPKRGVYIYEFRSELDKFRGKVVIY